ncbi:hypothetical protein DFH08DRAFT_326089 [Mycena albidolilacea]|uniref:Uncharacterized protein n=1 Tax=Mycena albidolilacea TaxID=1033008 RepID=A0AAD7AMY7_9AGAR|nr:hypothetical protein DFH08DRAFT_326089 [Mycena albidolilacea]
MPSDELDYARRRYLQAAHVQPPQLRGPPPYQLLRDNDGDDRHAPSRPAATPAFPTFANPTSGLPRFLQAPAWRGCSKSLSVALGQVWCTCRTGFEPIRDLPSLWSLPPPLFFLNAPALSSPSDSSGALAQSTGHGSNGAVVPHAQTPTSLRMQHSPSQSDSYSSSATSSSRRESGSGEAVRGASSHEHGHGSAHSEGSSYASYNSSGTSTSTSTSTSNTKKWWPLPGYSRGESTARCLSTMSSRTNVRNMS